jgi:hypothetical protein
VTPVRPIIVAPDTAHWANWIDDALSRDAGRRNSASLLGSRMLDAGRIPLLSWHHLEEMLCIDNEANARARVAYLRSMPLLAWMRLPSEREGIGAIVDILAAEAIAFDAGCSAALEVRDEVRAALLRSGGGSDAIGSADWVWSVARPEMMARRPHMGMVAALGGMRSLDETLTVGQLARRPLRPPEERRAMLAGTHQTAFLRALQADPRRSVAEARSMADEFVARVAVQTLPEGASTRDLIVSTHVRQGIDPDEITDDRTIAELSALGTFRSHLRVVASKTGLPFDRLKRVRMETLPSWRIARALEKHGQNRAVRPVSDVHDQHLAVLVAYTDELFVDKRTHEDFRRVVGKEPELARMFGLIRKSGRYSDLAA